MIAYVNYEYKQVLVKFIGTHAEYSRFTKRDIENL
jgi:mRNA-degrading endonuclease HigB of HigAB toxin-antitoxin module